MPASASAYLAFISLLLNQRKTQAGLRKLQEIKLKRLLNHAYENVPFYRNRYQKAGISPDDLAGLEDMDRLPLTFKQDLRVGPLEQTLAQGTDPDTCKTFSTSGTTGIPLKTYFSPYDSTLKNLGWIRAFWTSGLKPWQRSAVFIGKQQPNTIRSWYEYLGLWRRREISTWTETSAWIADLQGWKPHALQGYVMTLKILADEIKIGGHKGVNPKYIFHSSAILDQGSRMELEDTFGSEVIDIYGSDEAGCIAWECKQCQGYHLNMDTMIVEILKDDRPAQPGESGEVVITNLHSYAMPFIRYFQGDIVTLSEKEPVCGCTFPLIERIEGRTDDFITLADGRMISPHPVYHSIDPVPGILKWRLTQEDLQHLRLEIEPAPDFLPTTEDTIRKNFQTLFKAPFELEIVHRDRISIQPAQKFRAVCSKVTPTSNK